jgi:hypothetical protein
MAVTLTNAKIRVLAQALLNGGADLGTLTSALNAAFENAFTNGTGANQGNMAFHDSRTLADGANEDLDLAGVLASAFGATITFAAIKAIVIVARTANTTNLTVTRPANGLPFLAASGDGFVLKPGGMFVLTDPSAAGIAVTAGTGDLVNIANAAGAAATYDVILIGEV